MTCRIKWRVLFELSGGSSDNDKHLAGGFNSIRGDDVEVVDGDDPGELPHDAFEESEVAAGDADLVTTGSSSAGS